MASSAGKSVTKGGNGNSPFGKSSAGTVVRGKKDAAVASITAGTQKRQGQSRDAAMKADPRSPEGIGAGSAASC